MIILTKKNNKGIGEGECRLSYLLQHENFATDELGMEKDEEGNLLSPEFPCSIFLSTIPLATGPSAKESVVLTIARILMLDYLSKNEIKQGQVDNELLEKFPRSGKLKFTVPVGTDNVVCHYSPGVADQRYVENYKPRINAGQLANAYASPSREKSTEGYESKQGSSITLTK